MKQPIKHGTNCGGIAQQFAPIFDGRFEVTRVLARS